MPLGSFCAISSAKRLMSSLSLTSPCRLVQLEFDVCRVRCNCTHGIIWPELEDQISAVLSRTSSLLDVMYTFAPLATRACVIINPMPVPPPVTTAVTCETSKSLEPLRSSVLALPLMVRAKVYVVVERKQERIAGVARENSRSMVKSGM
jgi:hypothetical protein